MGEGGVKTKASMPPRLNNQRHNVGGVPDTFQIDRADMNLGDMGVINGAQKGGLVSSLST